STASRDFNLLLLLLQLLILLHLRQRLHHLVMPVGAASLTDGRENEAVSNINHQSVIRNVE
ncbi:hypothetical protein SK128_013613, partial [Halocaridina rubra]